MALHFRDGVSPQKLTGRVESWNRLLRTALPTVRVPATLLREQELHHPLYQRIGGFSLWCARQLFGHGPSQQGTPESEGTARSRLKAYSLGESRKCDSGVFSLKIKYFAFRTTRCESYESIANYRRSERCDCYRVIHRPRGSLTR